jgi:hypothetical protein
MVCLWKKILPSAHLYLNGSPKEAGKEQRIGSLKKKRL